MSRAYRTYIMCMHHRAGRIERPRRDALLVAHPRGGMLQAIQRDETEAREIISTRCVPTNMHEWTTHFFSSFFFQQSRFILRTLKFERKKSAIWYYDASIDWSVQYSAYTTYRYSRDTRFRWGEISEMSLGWEWPPWNSSSRNPTDCYFWKRLLFFFDVHRDFAVLLDPRVSREHQMTSDNNDVDS